MIKKACHITYNSQIIANLCYNALMFLLLCCNDNDDKGNDTVNHDVAKCNLYSTMCIKKGTMSGHVSEPAT